MTAFKWCGAPPSADAVISKECRLGLIYGLSDTKIQECFRFDCGHQPLTVAFVLLSVYHWLQLTGCYFASYFGFDHRELVSSPTWQVFTSDLGCCSCVCSLTNAVEVNKGSGGWGVSGGNYFITYLFSCHVDYLKWSWTQPTWWFVVLSSALKELFVRKVWIMVLWDWRMGRMSHSLYRLWFSVSAMKHF